jgi:hypothetical protein
VVVALWLSGCMAVAGVAVAGVAVDRGTWQWLGGSGSSRSAIYLLSNGTRIPLPPIHCHATMPSALRFRVFGS